MNYVLVLALIGGALACAGDDGGPRLDSASPEMAPRGATVTLTGTRLCGATGDCARAAGQVQLGLSAPTVQAQVVSLSASSAQIVVPATTPIGRTSLVVTVNDQASNALAFEVVP